MVGRFGGLNRHGLDGFFAHIERLSEFMSGWGRGYG
jgi:hypothetical protein